LWTEFGTENDKGTEAQKASEPIPSEVPPAMARMTRVVGHGLRNKLAVMKNSVYYLNMKLGHGDEKVKKHLKIMEREIAAADRIILNFMDFALLKEPVVQQSDIKAIVLEALFEACLPDPWEADLHLQDGLPNLMADAGQLQRAFTNIILRIAEGVPEGGKLQLSATAQNSFVEVGFWAPDLVIPQENLTAAALSMSAGDTDLGTIVSKRLVEGNGGTMEVRCLPGKGAVFTVRLPL
jgi:two-component system sensor histidine kinase HydH